MSRVVWVETDEALREIAASIGKGPLGLDTEADSFHHYREKVCLVQLSFGGRDVLVDPLAGVDLDALRSVLEDRGVVKVLHGADYDLRILQRDFGLRVRGLFDTMIAARLVGEQAFGLAALLESQLGLTIDKGHQRDDWSKRPLPQSMVDYAAADTRSLVDLKGVLAGRLDTLERRSWADEEFSRLEEILAEPRAERDAVTGRTLKGAQALDRRGLAVLGELSTWRESVARARDVPVFRVARDEVLVALSRARPKSPDDLRSIAGLPRPFLSPAGAAPVLAAVASGLSVPEEELPMPPAAVRFQRDVALEAKLLRLKALRDEEAKRLRLEPSLLASRALLEEILGRLGRGESLEGTPGIRRWQAAILARIV